MSVLDDLYVNLSINYSGLNKAIEAAKKKFTEYEATIKGLTNAIDVQFKASGLEEIDKRIENLTSQQRQVLINLKYSENITDITSRINTEIANLQNQIKEIEVDVNIDDETAEAKINEIKQKIAELEEERETKINLVMQNEEKLKQLETELAELTTKRELTLEASGISELTSELEEIQQGMTGVTKATTEVEKAFNALGVTGVLSFTSLVSSIKKGIQAYSQYVSALSGLTSQMNYIGEDMSKAQQIIEELTSDGLMSESDVATSIKNLTLYGMTLDEAVTVIERLKDSAAYAREAHYSLSEAVVRTTEGIKNENSVLSDAAGVTKNIAKMKEEYAAAIGKSYDSLTQEEKAMAVYNGVLEETEAVLGNAEKVANELSGTMSKASTQTKKLAQAFGSSLEPVVSDLLTTYNTLTGALTSFINNHQTLVSTITTATTAFLGLKSAMFVIQKLITWLKAVKTQLDLNTASATAFSAAVGGWSGILTIVGTVAAATFSSIKSWIQEIKEEQEEVNSLTEEFKELLSSATDDSNIDIKTSSIEELEQAKTALDEFIDKYSAYYNWQLTHKSFGLNNDSFSDILVTKLQMTTEEAENLENVLKQLGYNVNKYFSETDATNALEEIDAALLTLKNDTEFFNTTLSFDISLDDVVTAIDTIEDLRDVYETLASGGSLDNSELIELMSTYQELADYIAETGDVSLESGNKIIEIAKEQLIAQQELSTFEEKRIKNAISNTEKQIELCKTYIETLEEGTDEHTQMVSQLQVLETQLETYQETAAQAKVATMLLNDELLNFDATQVVNEAIRIEEECDTLYSYYETLADGTQLTTEETLSLIDTYPKLAAAFKETGDVTFDSGQLILEVLNDVRDAYDEKREALVNSCKAEIKVMESYLESMTALYEKERQSLLSLTKAKVLAYELDISVTYSDYNVPTFDEQQTAIQSAIEQKLQTSQKLLEELEKIGDISKAASSNYTALTDSITDSSSSATSAVESTTSALEEQLTIYNNLLAVTELSNEKQLEMLEEIRDKYAETADDYQQIDALIYSQRKTVLDEWYDEEIAAIQALNKGREDNTDFQAIINKYTEFLETVKEMYADYPETLKSLEDEINEYIVEATEARIAKIYNLEKEALDNRIEIYNDYISLMEKLDGLTIAGVEISFDYEDQAAVIENILSEIEEAINEFVSVHGTSIKTMSDTEKEYYEYLLDLQSTYQEEYLDLYIDYLKEKLEALEDYYEDEISALEAASEERISLLKEQYNEEVSLAKEKSEEIQALIKEQYENQVTMAKEAYEAEVAAAKEAANEQIAIYEERIAEIEALLTQASRDQTQDDIQDQIDRLYEQLKYETSEVNKYEIEKQIASLQAEYDYNEWKYALEDEKDALKDAISEIKEELSDKLEALKDELDAELEYLAEQKENQLAIEEQYLEDYLSLLEENLNAQIAAEEAATAQKIALLEKELETAKQTYSEQLTANKSMLNSILTATQKMYKQKEKATQNNVDTEISIVETGTELLINKLYSYGDNFADIGYTFAELFANAFNDGVSTILSSINDIIDETNDKINEVASAADEVSTASTLSTAAADGSSNSKARSATNYYVTQTFNQTEFTSSQVEKLTKNVIRKIRLGVV